MRYWGGGVEGGRKSHQCGWLSGSRPEGMRLVGYLCASGRGVYWLGRCSVHVHGHCAQYETLTGILHTFGGWDVECCVLLMLGMMLA